MWRWNDKINFRFELNRIGNLFFSLSLSSSFPPFYLSISRDILGNTNEESNDRAVGQWMRLFFDFWFAIFTLVIHALI